MSPRSGGETRRFDGGNRPDWLPGMRGLRATSCASAPFYLQRCPVSNTSIDNPAGAGIIG